ncbi:MAG TPA: hypothetical protein VLQ93_22010, partial [Myxococcaceae bacterium]|nr:hypothetical protein [Myxococcaceae bacterium]
GSPACPWGVADPLRSIRRVSLCQSVLEACSGGLGRCPVASVLPQVCPSHPASLPRLTAAQAEEAESHIKRTESGSSLNISLPPLDVCGHTTLHSGSSSYEETVCPFRQYYGAPLRPWSNPVASKNPCTACRMQTDTTSSTATLYLGIDSDFASHDLDEPTLLVNHSHEIELSSLQDLTGGNEVKVTDIQLDPTWLPVTHAELTLKGPGNDAYSSELLLEE